ncbi:oxygen-insensitive NAD(P)H nitroreductase [Orbaceae bacterium ac157xtp]
MNVTEISAKRYTTKHYDKSKKIPAEQVQQLLEILRETPSSVNAQPWHFIIADSDEAKQKILPAIVEFNAPRVTDSSLTIIMCAKNPVDDAHLKAVLAKEEQDGRFPNAELKQGQDQARRYYVNKNSSTTQDQLAWSSKQIYIALGNILYSSAAMGIDSTPIEGFDDKKLDEILDLKAKGLKSVVLVTLGYRSKDDSNAKRPKSRLDKEVVVSFL